MKKNILLSIFIVVCSLLFSQRVYSQIISEGSKVSFSVGHMGGTVDGTITGMQGNVQFDENKLETSRMEATVETKTVDTGNGARDSDLRKENFFDAERFPQIKFVSRTFSRTESGFQVTGDLTIKDRTREVIIPFRREQKSSETVFTGSFSLNRKGYNLGKSAFPPIGKMVKVHILAVVR